MTICPICKRKKGVAVITAPTGRDGSEYDCPVCGKYFITGTAEAMLSSRKASQRLSDWVQSRTERVPEVDSRIVRQMYSEATMFQSITVKNFKSYRNATLHLSPLTLLVGANASGKSNAIEAIRILAWLARGQRLDAITTSVQASDVGVRGRVQDLVYGDAQEFEVGCAVTNMEGWDRLRLRIGTRDEALRILDETIERSDGRFPLYRVASAATGLSHDLNVEYNNFARGGRKPQVACSDQLAVFTQLESSARFEAGHKKAQETIPRITKRYRELLANTLFLDPRPSEMRDYSFKTEKRLKDNGANISAVVFNLCQEASIKQQLIEFIASLPEQDIRDIGFIETPRSEVMLKLTESFGGRNRTVEAPLLSDGTLRVLSVAAALLSAPEGALVVIEEIDNGVHPSRAESLLKNIQAVAAERGLSVLLTSHNPALLDALPAEAVPKVLFCYRDPEEGDSRLVQLQKLPDFPELIAQGSLGHLMTAGMLERFIKFRPKGEEKQQQAMEWLQALKAEGSE